MADATAASHRARGILFLYHRTNPPWQMGDASNVTENIAAFTRRSRFPVWSVNTNLGMPPAPALPPRFRNVSFDAIVLHYSVFISGPQGYLLGDDIREHLARATGYKVAFFQDEYQWCKKRFSFIDEYGIDCVFSMLEPPYAEQVYLERTGATNVVSHLPSYVGPELLSAAKRFSKSERKRRIDVGYRGRPAPVYWGRGAQEKSEIGSRFAELAAEAGLRLDIATSEEDRIYGNDWNRFLANCVGTLGTESGVSCFDIEDEVLHEYQRLSANGREPSIEELEPGALGRWDGRIPYRTIGPRNLEAAAFDVCQILFEGRYSGLMEPMRHYIPLRKDFSNIDEVLERFRDTNLRAELTENAHRDLIASGENNYEQFIARFDSVLLEAGLEPERSRAAIQELERLRRGSLRSRFRRYWEQRWLWLYLNRRRTFRVVWVLTRPLAIPWQLALRILGRR